MLTTSLGVTAAAWGVAMAVSPLLQIRRMRHLRSSAGLSVGYMLVLVVGFVLWVAYGSAKRDIPIVVPNAVAFVVMLWTLAVARRYRGSEVAPREGAEGERAD
ncbi:MAG TPA: SemiSWEET family transporter, partial [Gaiellaceae bacterium]